MRWVALLALMEEASKRDEKRSVWPLKKPVQMPPQLRRKGFNRFLFVLRFSKGFALVLLWVWANHEFMGIFSKSIIYLDL